jgi:hypothetical protein
MKEKHKVFTVLEVEDVERLVSEMAGRDIKVGDMEVTLIDGVPLGPVMDGDIGSLYMTCEVRVDGEEIYDDDYNSPLDEYMPDYAYTPEEYIFDFDTSMFKSFERYTDSSD